MSNDDNISSENVQSFISTVGRLDADHKLPLYKQLADLITSSIKKGVIQRGSALPNERDLAAGYSVSRITVRKAIDQLASDGLVTTHRGAGTFVTNQADKAFFNLSSFSEEMRSRGRVPGNQWLSRMRDIANPEEAMALNLSLGSPIFRFERIRLADNKPVAFETSTIIAAVLPHVDSVIDSLYAALDAFGSRPTRVLQQLQAARFSKIHASAIGVESDHPAMFIRRRGLLSNNYAIEYTRSYYKGEDYDVLMESQNISGLR